VIAGKLRKPAAQSLYLPAPSSIGAIAPVAAAELTFFASGMLH
jgi:hypothetical protein